MRRVFKFFKCIGHGFIQRLSNTKFSCLRNTAEDWTAPDEANALGLQQRGPHWVKKPVAGKLSKFGFLVLKKICVSMFLHTPGRIRDCCQQWSPMLTPTLATSQGRDNWRHSGDGRDNRRLASQSGQLLLLFKRLQQVCLYL